MQSKPNLILTGFMGTGKTAVGGELSRALGRSFVDMDDRIEARAGMSIPAIFERCGEPHFRHLEREVCREVAGTAGLVVATGGGTLMDPANLRILGASGIIVCLSASVEIILARVMEESHRPLLESENQSREQRIRALLETRRERYNAIPLQVDTTGLSIAAVAHAVTQLLADHHLTAS